MELYGPGCHARPGPRFFHRSRYPAIHRNEVRLKRHITAAAIITDAVRSIPVKRVGYSGLMLPPLEDPVLAQGWSEKNYNIDSVLAYSAVCGTGLDTIPLPGDISQQQLERILGDVASLAFKWHKALAARLIPAPGKKAGDKTDFSFGIPGFPNVILQPLP